MRINRNHITSIFAIGAATVAIAAAPTASAAALVTPQSCSAIGDGSECQSPGNVQIDDSPPPVENFDPYGPFFLGLGGYGGGYHGGGGFGGGFGGGGGHR